MEWKDKGTEAIYVGLIAFIGSWLLKVFKRYFTPFKTNFNNISKIGEIGYDAHYSKELILGYIHFSEKPMFLMDMNGDLKNVNSAWLDATGFNDPQQAYDMGFLQAIPDRHVDMMIKKNEQFVKKPSNSEGIVVFKHIETGEEFKANVRTMLLRNKEGKPIMSLGILDIIKN